MLILSKRLPYEPFNAISYHSIAAAFRNRNAQAGIFAIIFSSKQKQIAISDATIMIQHRFKLFVCP